MKNIFLTFLFICFSSLNLFGSDKVYLLPDEADQAFKKLEKTIKKTKSKIDIAVYNFEYKKIAKLLKKAAKKGVEVNIIFEKEKLKNKKAKYDYLCESKNITCKIAKKQKQHIKLMVFDDEIAMFGSANLTKESFNENLELIYFTDEKETLKKFNDFFIKFF